MISRLLPPSNDATRQALYAGEVFLTAPTEASSRLVAAVRADIEDVLGPDPRRAQLRLDPPVFFAKVGALRRLLYLGDRYHALSREVMAGMGFDPAQMAFDPLRARVILHAGHEDPRAAAVYYPHRDIWYGHPPGLINWWIPLDDLEAAETFEFYPDYFHRPIPNDSEIFDYDAWVAQGWSLKIGWQDRDAGLQAKYPGIIGSPPLGPRVGFACEAGANLLFAGAHLHATRPQSFGRSRFSVEFRAVHLGDHAAGRAAPRIDDRSRGTALNDYIHPGQVNWPPHP